MSDSRPTPLHVLLKMQDLHPVIRPTSCTSNTMRRRVNHTTDRGKNRLAFAWTKLTPSTYVNLYETLTVKAILKKLHLPTVQTSITSLT
jgi:hypothetical protein